MVKREQEQYIVSVKINIVEKYFHWWPYFCYRPWITKKIVVKMIEIKIYVKYTHFNNYFFFYFLYIFIIIYEELNTTFFRRKMNFKNLSFRSIAMSADAYDFFTPF